MNFIFSIYNFVGWLLVGMLWHDRSLIVLNAFGIAIILTGIMNYLI